MVARAAHLFHSIRAKRHFQADLDSGGPVVGVEDSLRPATAWPFQQPFSELERGVMSHLRVHDMAPPRRCVPADRHGPSAAEPAKQSDVSVPNRAREPRLHGSRDALRPPAAAGVEKWGDARLQGCVNRSSEVQNVCRRTSPALCTSRASPLRPSTTVTSASRTSSCCVNGHHSIARALDGAAANAARRRLCAC